MLVPTVLARRFVRAPTLEQFHRSVPKVEHIASSAFVMDRMIPSNEPVVSDDEKLILVVRAFARRHF